MKFFVYLLTLLPVISALNFLAIGDWGGIPTAPYYTNAQLSKAQGMDKIAKEIDAKFVLAIGDNMYNNGVIDAEDPRFQNTFESVYSGDNLQVDWYMVPGNHDYRGNVTAEVEYTNISKRWNMPSLYYKKNFVSSDGVKVEFLFIDTVSLNELPEIEEEDPENFTPLPLSDPLQLDPKQKTWIETQLAASQADLLFVVGHYPVYSACSHGNTFTLLEWLKPKLEEAGAHYLAGHDHCLEHVHEDSSNIHHFLTGAGVECCYPAIRKHGIPENALKYILSKTTNPKGVQAGFSSYNVSKAGFSVTFHNEDGDVLYTTGTLPLRNKSN